VKRTDAKSENKREAKGQASSQAAAQSMMQVEWLTPAASGATSQQLNFALRSVAYTNPLYAHQQQEDSFANDAALSALASRPAPAGRSSGSSSGGGLLGGGAAAGAGGAGAAGGVVGGVTSTVGAATNAGGVTSAVGAATNAGGGAMAGAGPLGGQGAASAGVVGQTSAGLAAVPTLAPVNSQTAASLQNNFGMSSNQLFMVGHGQVVSSGGTASSMDIFSHMSNDSVITSPSKDFEIGTGAQMQFMVSGSAK
jgi:hypothetical protein